MHTEIVEKVSYNIPRSFTKNDIEAVKKIVANVRKVCLTDKEMTSSDLCQLLNDNVATYATTLHGKKEGDVINLLEPLCDLYNAVDSTEKEEGNPSLAWRQSILKRISSVK